MLIVGLDGYDYKFLADAPWKKRFDYVGKLRTKKHTIPSNCWVLTGHGTRINNYFWDTTRGKKLFSHRDLNGPFLWDSLSTYGVSQAWLSFPLMNPLVKLNNMFALPGILGRFKGFETLKPNPVSKSTLKEYAHQFAGIEPPGVSASHLVKLVDLQFEIYTQIYRSYDFIFLYIFWLDTANHYGYTEPVKSRIDDWLTVIPLHEDTVIYSDHGEPIPTKLKSRSLHNPWGIIAVKPFRKKIRRITEIHGYILENVNMSRKRVRKKKVKPKIDNTTSTEIMTSDTTTIPIDTPTIPLEPLFQQNKRLNIKFKVYCPTCKRYTLPKQIGVNPNGVILYELDCGHQQAFHYKVELHGEKAVRYFAKG